jgi:hypothetical protein
MYGKEDAAKLVNDVVAKMAQSYGEDLDLLDRSADATGQEQKVCTMLAAYFAEIMKLPRPVAGALLRSSLSGSQ